MSQGLGAKTPIRRQMATNAATTVVVRFIKAAVALAIVPFLIGKHGQVGYGVVILTGVVLGIPILVATGLQSAVVRHMAERVSLGDHAGANAYSSTALFLFVGLGILIGVALILAAPLLLEVAGIHGDTRELAEPIFRWYLGVALPLEFAFSAHSAVLTALNRYDLKNYINAIQNVLVSLALFVVLSTTDFGLIGWAAVSIVGLGMQAVVCAVAARYAYPALSTRLGFVSGKALRDIMDIGKYFLVATTIKQLKFQLDPLLISRFLGPAAVSIYRPGAAITEQVRPIIGALSGQLIAVTTALHAQGDQGRLNEAFSRVTKYTVLLGIAVPVILGVFAEPLMQLWLGDVLTSEQCKQAATVLQLWTIVDFLYYSEGALWNTMVGMNRVKWVVALDLCLAVMNFGATIALLAYTDIGVVAAIIPTVVIELIGRPTFIVIAVRICGMRVADFVRRTYSGAAIVLFGSLVFALVVREVLDSAGLAGLALAVLLSGLVWLSMTWALGLDTKDRQMILQLGRSYWRKNEQAGF